MRGGRRLNVMVMLVGALVWMGGCDRGPEQRLVGDWVVDVTATREHMQQLMDAEGHEEGSPERALIEGLMAGLEQQQREYAFRRDGTFRARISLDQGPMPGGMPLHSSDGKWEVIEATNDTLTIRLASDDEQLDGWQHTLHFESDDRLYYQDDELRHYWKR